MTVKHLADIDDKKLAEKVISNETAKNGRVSLFFGELDEQNEIGLCHDRFKADIVIDSEAKLKQGDNLLLGDSVILTVSGRKQCFPECALFFGGIPCRLQSSVVFASVKNNGTVRLGDIVHVLYE